MAEQMLCQGAMWFSPFSDSVGLFLFDVSSLVPSISHGAFAIGSNMK